MKISRECLYIDDREQLEQLCRQLADSTVLALDTEFMRETTYFPRLCLLQVSNGEIDACIDPLALDDLGPFLELVYRDDILKIFHAGGQDLEILYHLTGGLPAPLFDTQLAAPLLGLPLQSGYAALLNALLGISLDKSHTRTDWSRRPLSPAQLSYACDDVRYLVPLYHEICARLGQSGRLAWLDDDFAELADPARLQTPDDAMWMKIKGAQRLRDGQLAVLQALAAWRERQARDRDRPRNRILRDDILLDLARLRPRSLAALEQIRGLGPQQIRQHGDTLLDLIAAAASAPVPERPQRGPQLSVAEEALSDCLMAVLRLCGERHDINPAVLANRRELERLVGGERDLPLLQGWRRHLAGNALLDYLDGNTRLQVMDGKAMLQERSPA